MGEITLDAELDALCTIACYACADFLPRPRNRARTCWPRPPTRPRRSRWLILGGMSARSQSRGRDAAHRG